MTARQVQPGNSTGQARCLLVLEDGRSFSGTSFGASGTTGGELVFNTSMTGYQEILTDPSYSGQIITLTCPEIGNYGTNDTDLQSERIHAQALVVRHPSRQPSSWRTTRSLPAFLQDQGIIGLAGVDTRAITKHIRDKGAMRAAISTQTTDPDHLVDLARSLPEMTGSDLTGQVTTDRVYTLGSGSLKLAVMDFGIKKGILNNLINQGFELTVYPACTSARQILASQPDGIFLSNGPGDPQACRQIIPEIKELLDSGLPLIGICLGHQLVALALGARTYKLKFGHRGSNQPVANLLSGGIEITCQNHGFAVDRASLPSDLVITHVNLNDDSLEGFQHRQKPLICVQYHPEASPGPRDSGYLFARFKELIAQRN